MPYEVSMSGGAPWGFRIAGGPFAGKPTTISRITPGGKAAQANVMQGDVLIAINGFTVSHLDLTELMEMIKLSGWTLHLTLISQEEISQITKQKRHSEANITNAIEIERPRSQLTANPVSLCGEMKNRPESQLSSHHLQQDESTQTQSEVEISDDKENNETKSDCNSVLVVETPTEQPNTPNEESASVSLPVTPVQACPTPKPRRPKSVDFVEDLKENHSKTEKLTTTNNINEEKKMPDFLRRQLKPPKPLPPLKPQVHWLHDKLKITPRTPNGLKDPGHSLKVAAAAYPSRKIEIEGPVSATIVHSQYNTPVGMYSANQIVSTLVNTAAATGARVPDPNVFGDKNVNVDQNTAVYKMVHHTDKPRSTPAQSRSIKILDALLEHGQEIPQKLL